MIDDKLLSSDPLQKYIKALKAGHSVVVENLWNSPKALTAALASHTTEKHLLIITGASLEEVRLFNDFSPFTSRKVIDYPAWETLPSENIAPSPDVVGDRYKTLQEITQSTEPLIILSNLQACLQKVITPEKFRKLYKKLKVGDKHPFEKLLQEIQELGYTRTSIAGDKGEYAIRGGIIDLFPVSSPDPYRIEFWDNEIESIRIYDPISQKSIKRVESIDIPPGNEIEFSREGTNLSTILEYLGKNTLVIFDDLLSLEDRYASLVSMCGQATPQFASLDQLLELMSPLQKIFWPQQNLEELGEVTVLEKISGSYYSTDTPLYPIEFSCFGCSFRADRWNSPFETIGEYLFPDDEDPSHYSGTDVLSALGRLKHKEIQLKILCASELEESQLKRKISEAQIDLPKHTTFERGYLSGGFALKDCPVVILPLTEITHRYKIRRQKQRSSYQSTATEVYELTPGELIVHLNHGIGKYLGIEKKLNHNGILSEFFKIEYADNATLFVPMNQSYLISKYIGAHEEIPKMHTIGSKRWKLAKEKTEQAIIGYAADLLEMYAKREIKGGFNYPTDSQDMLDFEEEFPFVETEDQLAAVAEIKNNLCSPEAMDRLICGDVGYGKTEVAMRAAFKAVVDGRKQVAILVPTTVLAMQHFDNFRERMENFPVTVEVLSRFRTAKETKKALEGLAAGSVDIIIGTHRLVSDDVIFKDLGLIIIDEEQRFGVKAKEHLKKIKMGVDCLTMSATPIPRTLYMSLIGARDMSVINTPPQDRLPISTQIVEPNDQLLKNALMRELSRNGQAYVIHNRVETIFEKASHIQKLLPQARIAVVHGQMHPDEIDQAFHKFKSGNADILVATTIVESGIDIPNANTILIDRADTFGIADLYQLRGRVGRWNRRAYAYFMVPRLRSLPEISRKRLNALAEASGYGGGMKVAMRDLEIRGAGNILGMEQSGHVSSIGFHLYCKLLKRTIKVLQGKISSTLTDVKIECAADARIPDDYIHETNLRIEIYQRLGEAVEESEVEEIFTEIADRFGKYPLPVKWLYHLTKIRVFASKHSFTLLKWETFSMTAERQLGKKSVTKKILFSKTTDPAVFETRTINALKKEFLL